MTALIRNPERGTKYEVMSCTEDQHCVRKETAKQQLLILGSSELCEGELLLELSHRALNVSAS